MIFKKIKIALVLLCICLVQSGRVIAQNNNLEKANKAYDKFAFVEAGKLYEEQVNKGGNTAELYIRLGDCYYYNGEYSKAVNAYGKVIESSSKVAPAYYFRYAQALNNSNYYKEAEAVMKKYYLKSGKKDLSGDWNEVKLMEAINLQSGRYTTIKPVEINTAFSDFGTAFYGENKAIYASAKDTGVIIKRKHSWNEKSFLKLYTADITIDGGLQNPSLLKGDVNTRYHQSTPVVTKDGKFMYFTRNNYLEGKLGGDKKGTTFLKIYVAENINGEWKNIKELPYPINSDGFSSAHPALSPDETQLFFASDRNNDFGNSDLYVVSLVKGALVGNDVTKLGNEINTLGRETYPFVDDNGILYFASDGHPGLGGLDIFAAIKDAEGKYHAVNVGKDINSSSDDFAYVINDENKKGYFSSNRNNSDDIFSFTELKPVLFDFDFRPVVFGTVKEKGVPVPGFSVKLLNENKEVIGITTTNDEGKYEIKVDPFKKTELLFTKEQYAEKTISTEKLKPMEKREVSLDITKELEILVDGTLVTINENENLGEILKLNPIYFDLNGFNIRQSSKKELDKVVAVMRDYPKISIKVNSYTDSRGRDDFNMKLSQNRAKATVNYIINAGIAKERLSGEGFGETHLLNHCSNGVVCSEKEHELNRRSEFIISFK